MDLYLSEARKRIQECLKTDSKELDLSDCKIDDLNDLPELQECESLESLNISGIKVSDLRPLSGLTNLTSLNFCFTKVSDLRPLLNLTNLTSLYFDSTEVSDLRPLLGLTNLTILFFSGTKVSDLSLLSNLTNLTSLNFSVTKVSDLSPLSNLTNLTSLYFDSTEVSDLRPLLGLTNLTILFFSGTKVSDLSLLSNLINLTSLSFSFTKVSDLSFLSNLTNLTSLYFDGTEVSDLRPLLGLTNLTILFFSGTKVSDLSLLSNLLNLKRLVFGATEVSDLRPLSNLINLTDLIFGNTKVSDLRPLSNLINLTDLNLSITKVSDLSPLSNLLNLKRLVFGYTKINYIPKFIFKLVDYEDIVESVLDGNQITNPPVEIIHQGREAVFDWFASKKESFNEIKVILVGDPVAGKTSLLKRLESNTFCENEQQTDGINIVDIDFGKNKNFKDQTNLHNIQGKFWDFGGQEIMSATHSLFLSNRSVYILLLQARDDKADEKQVRSWVKQIKATSGDSPIIVVSNKIDLNPAFDFSNKYKLQKDFPQIEAFIKISCLSEVGINELKEKLAQIIPHSGFLDSEIDVRYIALKKIIKQETKKESYLDERTFIEFCNRKEVNLNEKRLRENAIKFLDQIGIASHFPKIVSNDIYVLNPNWVASGIYKIITSKKVANNKGEVLLSELDYILNKENTKTKGYNSFFANSFEYNCKDERSFIAEVLRRYKLAFSLDQDKFIIPSLLEVNPKKGLNEKFDNSETLDFIFKYESLPKILISELLVEFHKWCNLAEYWRTGGVVKYNNAEALVIASDDKIEIKILSDFDYDRRNLMINVRAIIENVNKKLTNSPQGYIPLPGVTNDSVSYELLKIKLKRGKKVYYYHEDLDDEKKFNIRELLDGYLDEDAVNKPFAELLKKIDNMSSDIKEIKSKFDQNFDYLIDLNKSFKISKIEVENAVNAVSEENKKIVFKEMKTILDNHFDKFDNKLKCIYNDLQNSDDISAKLELSVPFLSLLGVNIKTEFDLKNWSEKMFEKHKLKIFQLPRCVPMIG